MPKAEWKVKYISSASLEVCSPSTTSRDLAIKDALKLEKLHTVKAIVGPSGEEDWAQVRPKH